MPVRRSQPVVSRAFKFAQGRITLTIAVVVAVLVSSTWIVAPEWHYEFGFLSFERGYAGVTQHESVPWLVGFRVRPAQVN